VNIIASRLFSGSVLVSNKLSLNFPYTIRFGL